MDNYAGSLDALARSTDGIEELARRLAGLAPGVGTATVARFLRPLRHRWPSAWEVPLTPAARAAAVHLGWIDEWADTEGEPGALAAFLRDEVEAPALADVEAALGRLGAAACRRNRTRRCPLEDGCPARLRSV